MESMSGEEFKRLGRAGLMARKRSKFGVRLDARGKRERTVDGILFASKHEALRYMNLKLLVRAKEISDLQLQPKFDLHIPMLHVISEFEHVLARHKIGSYVADFSYVRDGKKIYEDVKGVRTELFNWKKKHVEAEYGIEVVLI